MKLYPTLSRFLLSCSLVLAARASLADDSIPSETPDPNRITVTCGTVVEDATLVLPPNKKAQLDVFLMSAGDPIDGYKVELMDVRNQKQVAIVPTPVDGLLRFRRLAPGAYRVYLRKSADQVGITSVRIGDLKLKEEN